MSQQILPFQIVINIFSHKYIFHRTWHQMSTIYTCSIRWTTLIIAKKMRKQIYWNRLMYLTCNLQLNKVLDVNTFVWLVGLKLYIWTKLISNFFFLDIGHPNLVVELERALKTGVRDLYTCTRAPPVYYFERGMVD